MILLALLTILFAGAAVFYVIVDAPEKYARLERIAYCWPLGMIALGIPMFLLSWAGCHLSVAMGLSIVVVEWVLAKMIGAHSWQFWVVKDEDRPPFTEFEWFLFIVVVGCLAARFACSMLAPLNDNDGVAVWALKAKILYYDTLRHTSYFQQKDLAFSNHSYPLLWPMMYAWACTCMGNWDDQTMMVLNPLNLVVFAVLLYYACCRHVRRTVAMATVAMMVSLPALLHYTECGQADVPLMLMAGASFFCLFDWMHEGRTDSILLTAVLMGGCLWLKLQGDVVFVAYLLTAGIFYWKRLRQLAWLGGIPILLFLPWLIFLRLYVHNWHAEYENISFAAIRWRELPNALVFIAENSVRWYNSVHLAKWNLLWPVLVLAAVTSKCVRQNPWRCIVVAWALQSGAIVVLYLIVTEPIRLGAGTEFQMEREALIILAPLWLLFAKCVDEHRNRT